MRLALARSAVLGRTQLVSRAASTWANVPAGSVSVPLRYPVSGCFFTIRTNRAHNADRLMLSLVRFDIRELDFHSKFNPLNNQV